MIRSFIFNTSTGSLSVTESAKPNSVVISIRGESITLSHGQFEELASLSIYSRHGDSIKWVVMPPEPKQSELDLPEPEPHQTDTLY